MGHVAHYESLRSLESKGSSEAVLKKFLASRHHRHTPPVHATGAPVNRVFAKAVLECLRKRYYDFQITGIFFFFYII